MFCSPAILYVENCCFFTAHISSTSRQTHENLFLRSKFIPKLRDVTQLPLIKSVMYLWLLIARTLSKRTNEYLFSRHAIFSLKCVFPYQDLCDPDIVCINIDFQETDTNTKYHQPIVNARPSRIQIVTYTCLLSQIGPP